MRIFITVPMTMLLVACQSGPRPFDGVLGYKVSRPSTDRIDVSYIEEDSLSIERELRNVSLVCASELQVAPEKIVVGKVSSTSSEREIEVSLLVPGAAIPTGDIKYNQSPGSSGSASGMSAVMGTVKASEKVTRKLRIRSSEYQCSVVGAGSP